MPRDSSGNMTLVAGNPNVPATVISSSGWSNPTMDDFKAEITNSLDRNGRGGMLAPFRFVDGDAAGPGISWTNEPGTGIYRAGTGDMRVSVQGADSFRWAPTPAVWNVTDAIWYAVADAKYFAVDGDSAQLLENGLVALETQVSGILVFRDGSGGPAIFFGNSDEASIGSIQAEATGDMVLRHLLDNRGIQLIGTNSVSAQVTLFAGDPNGESEMMFAGVGKIRALTDGGQTTGNHKATAAAPSAISDLTRKDYVDGEIVSGVAGLASEAYVDAADALLQSDIDDNTGDIATNTAELAGISSNTSRREMRIADMMTLSGSHNGGPTHIITFDTPFTSVPNVTALPNSLSGNDLYISAISTTGVTIVSFASNTVHWIAMGPKTN